MQYTYDINNNLTQPKLILTNPQQDDNIIGLLSGVKDLKIKPYFASISEMEFKIYKYSNGRLNKYYDKLEEGRLIQAEYIAWFQIKTVKEEPIEKSKYKTVTCLSLENELVKKRIDDINGTFALLSHSETDKSLLHIIASSCNWNIGIVDVELQDIWRTFEIDSDKIYNFLTTTVAKSFACVFQFDTFTRTINCYKLENIGKQTNIIISDKNVLKSYVKESDLDKIVTKMRVKGADGLDIREVNFGQNYIINVDYYMNENWMTNSLITALQNYKTKTSNYQTQFTNNLTQLKTYQAELTILQTELNTLQSEYNAANNVCGTYISQLGRVPIPSDSVYSLYQSNLTIKNTKSTAIINKNNEIRNKTTQINNTRVLLDDIGYELDYSSNFTQAQLNELDGFLIEGDDYIDETFCETDLMTQEEVIDMKLELLSNATNKLARISRPQYTINTTISNLLTIQDNKDSGLSLGKYKDDFVTGNIITLKYSDTFMVGIRLMSMELDYNNKEDIDVVFSDKSRLDDNLIQLGEILAQADRTATTVGYEKIGWNKASNYTNEFREFKNGMLNLANNAIKTNDGQEPIIDNYGIHMKKWLPDQNIYSPYQARFVNNMLLFTNDSWNSSIGGIGVFKDITGVESMAVFADVLAGDIIIGNRLNISNSSGSYTITNNGFQASKNGYAVTINPNTPSEIFKVSLNGTNKLYIDAQNNELMFNGKLTANAINAEMINALNIVASSVKSDWVYAGNINASQITAGTISGDRINGGTITGSEIKSTWYNSGDIIKLSMTTVGYDIEIDFSDGDYSSSYWTHASIGFSYSPYGGSNIQSSYGRMGMNIGTGFSVDRYGDVVCGKINNGTPITTNNYGSLNITYPPSSHNHTGYASSDHTQSSYTITPVTTAAGNISLLGSPNAASPPWCEATFVKLSSSDFRLKKNIQTFDLPDEIFMGLKPKRFEFKCDDYNKGIVFGLLSQQVESIFDKYGYDPYLYNLIELVEPKSTYTDEGLYIGKDKVHRINYDNFIIWLVHIVQKQQTRIEQLEKQVNL